VVAVAIDILVCYPSLLSHFFLLPKDTETNFDKMLGRNQFAS